MASFVDVVCQLGPSFLRTNVLSGDPGISTTTTTTTTQDKEVVSLVWMGSLCRNALVTPVYKTLLTTSLSRISGSPASGKEVGRSPPPV
ncbi:hypothetical protein HDU76_008900, partial [Blyttiomyces sp. JEL0837]